MQTTPSPAAEVLAIVPQASTRNTSQGTAPESGESFSSHLAAEAATQRSQQPRDTADPVHPKGQIQGNVSAVKQTKESVDADHTEEATVTPFLPAQVMTQQMTQQVTQQVTQQISILPQQQPRQGEMLLENVLQGTSNTVSVEQSTFQLGKERQGALQQAIPGNDGVTNQRPLQESGMSPQSTTQQVQGITAGVTPTGTHPLLNQLHEANGETPVVIQQWSAKYSPTQAVQTTITEEAGAPQTQGQVIAVYQTEEAEEFIQRAAPIHQNGPQQPRQQFETNGNFIQSHMPNNAVQTASGSQTEQSAGEETGQPNQNAITTLQTDQLKAGEVQAGKEGPQILFTTEPGQAATTTQTAATVSPAGSFIKLPSGFTVPEGAVMDQVINHFSATLKLESGTVSLKLYPKELGELQMEIQVKNDNIKAHITAQNLQAQEALDRHLPRLKATLAEQGFELRQVEITVAASDQYDGQPFQENLERHQLAQSHTSGSDNSYYRSAGEEAEEPQPVELQGLSVTA